MASAKLRAMIAPRPPAPAGDEGPRHPSIEAATAAIDLLPIPAVLLHRQHGKFAFDAINKPFRVAGLGGSAEQSQLIADLGERIAAFIESETLREELPWQVGDTVDRRSRARGPRRSACRTSRSACRARSASPTVRRRSRMPRS